MQNLITGNSAVTGGGIYYNAAFSQSSLLNNTVAGNFALSAGALFVDGGDSGLSIMDNLLIDPTGVGAVACGISGGQTPNFFFNDVFSAGQPKLAYTMGCQDQTGFNGNIKQDPQFVEGNSDFHLTAGSPAIDAGNPLLGLPFGQQAPALDLDGKGRIGPGDASTCAGMIDMGVYEFALNATGNVLPLPSSWDFGSAFVGSSGDVFNFPIIAQGCVQLASVQTTGDFQQTNNCGAAVSSSCSIQVTFAPANSGLRTGTLTVDFGSTSPAQTVALTGQGSGASHQAAPSSFFFGDQQTQTSSSAQLISLFPFNFNSQLLINAIWISGDFSQMNNCAVPPSPPTGVACTLNVVFTPTAVGPRTGSIIISSNQGTLTIPLSGNGVTTAIPVLSTNDLVFPDQGVQTSSAAQVVTLINKGNGTLQIQGFGISGDFSVTPSAACATAQNLDPGQSCTYSIVFTPQVAGIRVGSFSLQTNGGSVGVTLTGSGVIGVASVSPLSLSFAAQVVQTASSAQTITLSSTGGLPVTVTSIAASGDFSQTNNCGTSLAPGTACSISVIFTPSATGNRSGSLAIATNAGAFSASLSGLGAAAQAQVAPQSLAFGSELANMPSRAQTVTLTAGVNSLQISSIIASGDFTQTSNCGAALAPASSCSIQVTFTPTVTAPRNGALTVSSNEGSLTAPLSGVGITHAANTIYVPADQSTIQAAINAAVDGQSVLVLPGTYPERIDFHGKAITVASTDGPGLTTIDGGLVGTVVNFTTGEGNASLLKGFTITHGTSTFEGAGIFISSASPTIDGNVITGNQGCQGIGIGIAFSTPIIRNNTISNNVQKTCSGGQGGGISVRGTGAPQILNNLITDNHLDNGGDGGGIALNGAAAIISGNTISGNTAFNNGGGIGLFNDSPATITQNLVIGNATRSGDGGGMYLGVPSGGRGPFVVNNTVAGNSALDGSAAFVDGFPATTKIVNNIFAGSSSVVALQCSGLRSTTPPLLSFNNAFSNGAPAYGGTCATLAGTSGNISLDPEFVDAVNGNYHLQAASSAIDAGNNSDPNLPQLDLDGNPRIAFGSAATCVDTVDLGVYEFVLTTPGAGAVTPANFDFGVQSVGTSSSAQTFTITASQGCLAVGPISSGGDFTQTNNCSSVLATGASCTAQVTFTPSAAGLRSGSLTVPAGNTSLSASLSGTGGVAMAAISPGALSFGNQLVGTTGAAQSLTLTNTGNISITISGITISGDFAQTNACGSTLSPGAACIISVTFTPTTRFSRAGVLSIQSNATPPAPNVSLSGTGIAPVPAFTPASAGFGNQRVGTSASQTLTLTNNGDAALSENGFSIAGSSGFTQTTNCPSSLSPGASCSVIVTFMPLSRGTKTATLSLNTQQPFTASAALSGTGIAPVAALTAGLSFAPQIVRTTTTQTAVLANNGDASLAIASISITGDFAQSNTCPATLAPAASCSIQVSFTPSASGARSGSLTVSDDDPASPAQTTALSGTGLDYSATASPGSVTVRAGSTALYTVTATALGGTFPNSVNLSCSGLPTSGTCTFSPAAISPGGGSSSSSLQITTGNGQHGTKKTPAGTYIITIAGASGSLSHTSSVTLIVQ